jgi:hypothetical protein
MEFGKNRSFLRFSYKYLTANVFLPLISERASEIYIRFAGANPTCLSFYSSNFILQLTRTNVTQITTACIDVIKLLNALPDFIFFRSALQAKF